MQDYRSRKRQRLRKRISEQLRQGVQIARQSSQFASVGGGAGDFEQFLAGFAGGWNKNKCDILLTLIVWSC